MSREAIHALYPRLTDEHKRYDAMRRSGTAMTEAEHDQDFDIAVALAYLDDERDIPSRVLARILHRLLTGEVTLDPSRG